MTTPDSWDDNLEKSGTNDKNTPDFCCNPGRQPRNAGTNDVKSGTKKDETSIEPLCYLFATPDTPRWYLGMRGSTQVPLRCQ
jgi:hypothetical protein